jgi:hypothetical protein
VTLSRADRVSVTEAALEKGITFLDSTALFANFGTQSCPDSTSYYHVHTILLEGGLGNYGMTGVFYSQLAEFDLVSNQIKILSYLGRALSTIQ